MQIPNSFLEVGWIFSSNLSGETSTLHILRLQTPSERSLLLAGLTVYSVTLCLRAVFGLHGVNVETRSTRKKKKKGRFGAPLLLILCKVILVYFVHICAQLLGQMYCK